MESKQPEEIEIRRDERTIPNETRIEEPEGSKVRTSNTSKKLSVGFLDIVAIALITAVLTVAAYDRFFAGKVVIVDLSGFVKEQKELFSQGKIGEAEVSDNLSRFQEFINSQPKNLTVITKDVVLAGGKELPIRLPTVNPGPGQNSSKLFKR